LLARKSLSFACGAVEQLPDNKIKNLSASEIEFKFDTQKYAQN